MYAQRRKGAEKSDGAGESDRRHLSGVDREQAPSENIEERIEDSEQVGGYLRSAAH